MNVGKGANPLLALPRSAKRLLAAGVDSILCALTVWIAFYLRLGRFEPMVGWPLAAIGLSVMIALPAFYMSGLYRIAFRRAGAEIISPIAFACTGYGLCYASIVSAYAFDNVPRTIGIIQPILLFLAVSLVRTAAGRFMGGGMRRGSSVGSRGNVVIYGAGSSGRQLAVAITASHEFNIVGFLDDDRSLHGTHISAVRVYPSERLGDLVERKGVSRVLLALPSASRSRRNEIINGLRNLPVEVRTLPGLIDLAHGHLQATDLRELTIDDLLPRDPVDPEIEAIGKKLGGKTVLITGAGGSIGSELCRQICSVSPAIVLLVERSEFALYTIHRELSELGVDVEKVPLLASVLDRDRMREIMKAWQPDIVFHAAAYKHVPLVEHNPIEGLNNNVIGTLCVAELAVELGITDFVLISTDKAVRPTNIMGATKRLAELILQGLAAQQNSTCFSMVRFGNVLGSSGSVVPLFREQIRRGGPITITHVDITRYFMTIPEAAQLVLQASAMARGGEVFVLDMGAPVRIVDLAKNMIELCGLKHKSAEHPDGDIEIQFVGMRPGEKLYEELLIGADPQPTAHPRIMKATEHRLPWAQLRASLDQLEGLIDCGNVTQARDMLKNLVIEFVPNSDIVDWVMSKNNKIAGNALNASGDYRG